MCLLKTTLSYGLVPNINVHVNPQMVPLIRLHMVLVYLYPQAKPFDLNYLSCNNTEKALMYEYIKMV